VNEADIPACGFFERGPGDIVWGGQWTPGRYELEPVVVEYSELSSGLWVPRQAWVRGEFGIDMHDCDWVESEGCIYHSLAGSGQPYINGYSEPATLPGRVWIGDGHHVVDACGGDKHPLSDDELLERGIRRVRGPTPTPLADAADGETHWCEVCSETIPADDAATCCVCEEETHVHLGSAVALVDPCEGGIDSSPVVYAILSLPFMTSCLIGGGTYHDRALARVGDLPPKVDTWGYSGAPLCRSCAPGSPAPPRPMTAYELGLMRRIAWMPGDALTRRLSERLVELAARASVAGAPPEFSRLLAVVRERATPEMEVMEWIYFRELIRSSLTEYLEK